VKEDFSQDDVNIINKFDTFCPNGPPHAKVFTAFLTLDGQTYSATGLSKETAEANVSELALQCCIQLGNSAAVFNNSFTKEDVKGDFSQDDVNIINKFDTFSPNDIQGRRNNSRLTEQKNPKASSSSPSFILNKLRPGLVYKIIKEEGKPHEKIFTAQGKIKQSNIYS
jgi:spermatid perinuclear RNA-binding protein